MTAGAPAAGANLPPDARGGEGWLSSIFLEVLEANRMLSDSSFTLQALDEIKTLLRDIAGSLETLAKKG